jgi:5-formyltetrahydrofolate cyclo-ligase
VSRSKAEWRTELKARRRAVANRPARTAQLWSGVESLADWHAARTVMLYLSFGTEPDTSGLCADALGEGKRVLVPRVEGDELLAVVLADTRNRSLIGVDEPTGEPIDVEEIDFVLVPGLGFTASGHRIGFGRGYYDRFLATLPDSCLVVGACFAECLVDELPLDAWDRPVDIVLTA